MYESNCAVLTGGPEVSDDISGFAGGDLPSESWSGGGWGLSGETPGAAGPAIAEPDRDRARQVLIHIGYHKCASTFLQRQVFPLLNVGYVPMAGHERDVLAELGSPHFDEEKFRKWVDRQLAEKCSEADRRWLILSHEQLSGHPTGRSTIDYRRIAGNLYGLYPQARFLIVIRNQFNYMRSVYSFRVAVHGDERRTFEEFVREEGEAGLFRKMEYDRLVSFYANLVGRENLLVLPLELMKVDMGRFILSVQAMLDGLNIPPIEGRTVNPSTQLQTVTNLWRMANILFVRAQKLTEPNERLRARARLAYFSLKRKTTPRLNQWLDGGPHLRLSEELVEQLEPRFAASNRRLQSCVPADLEALGYSLSAPVQSQR